MKRQEHSRLGLKSLEMNQQRYDEVKIDVAANSKAIKYEIIIKIKIKIKTSGRTDVALT